MNKYLVTLLCLFFFQKAQAHVLYVATSTNESIPSSFSYFLYGINPLELFVSILSVLMLGSLVYLFSQIEYIKKMRKRVDERLVSYHEFIPWVIRLSLGIAFIGAGTSSFLINPSLIQQSELLSVIQIILGFSFLLGFLLVPATIIGIILYFLALSKSWYLIGSLDVLALLFGVFVFHSGRPGLDDILGFSILKKIKIHRDYLQYVLEIGMGVSLMFLALYEKLIYPELAAEVVRMYHLQSFIPVTVELWVFGAGMVELLLGIFFLLSYRIRFVSVVTFLVLSISFFFFKESVTSHVTLFGLLSILFILDTKKDRKTRSIEGIDSRCHDDV